MESDTPDFRFVASWDTVDGVLLALRVLDAPLDRQRAAVRGAMTISGTRSLLEPLLPELRARGLL